MINCNKNVVKMKPQRNNIFIINFILRGRAVGFAVWNSHSFLPTQKSELLGTWGDKNFFKCPVK